MVGSCCVCVVLCCSALFKEFPRGGGGHWILDVKINASRPRWKGILMTLISPMKVSCSCSKTRTCSRGLRVCSPGKFLNFTEVQNGHFLRFKGDIHAESNEKLRDSRKITPQYLYLYL